MALVIASIPTEPSTPYYDQEVVLDGRNFSFGFFYNSRQRTWTVSLSDTNGLICSFKPMPNADVLAPFRYNERCPQGILIVSCSSPVDDTPPELGELDQEQRTVLLYITAG